MSCGHGLAGVSRKEPSERFRVWVIRRSPHSVGSRTGPMSDRTSRALAARLRAAKCWYVYLVLCRNGALYTGIARDVAARYAQHLAGTGAPYTRANPPRRLLVKFACLNQSEASHGGSDQETDCHRQADIGRQEPCVAITLTRLCSRSNASVAAARAPSKIGPYVNIILPKITGLARAIFLEPCVGLLGCI